MSQATSGHAGQAARLAGLWHRLSTQHVSMGCSCLMSGISVTLEDFERDIADYLWAESERLDRPDVTAYLFQHGPLATQPHAVRALLQRLEDQDADSSVAEWLLERLAKTIDSYARLHGPAPEAPLLGGSTSWRTGYRT